MGCPELPEWEKLQATRRNDKSRPLHFARNNGTSHSFPKRFRRLLSRNVNALARQKQEMTLCKKHFQLSPNAVTLDWNLLEQEARRGEYTEVRLQSLRQN